MFNGEGDGKREDDMKDDWLFIGIDPGKRGAIAILSNPVQVVPTPLLIGRTTRALTKTGKPTTRKLATDLYDVSSFVQLFLDITLAGTVDGRKVHVCFEELKTLPGMIVKNGVPTQAGGGKANFGRGYAMGMIESVLTTVQKVRPPGKLVFQSVKPQTWMKTLHGDLGGGDPKLKSLIVARRLFPLVSLKRTERSRKDDDGIADALLIAEYGRRTSGSIAVRASIKTGEFIAVQSRKGTS